MEGGCTGMVRGTQLALVTICYNLALASLQEVPKMRAYRTDTVQGKVQGKDAHTITEGREP